MVLVEGLEPPVLHYISTTYDYFCNRVTGVKMEL
ncbi:hypothetical protein PhaeoP48_01890 [Phaeobacter inhibens]|nr:hypothetical protein PhaeoP48_01890 [Phaeobacter inhibens]